MENGVNVIQCVGVIVFFCFFLSLEFMINLYHIPFGVDKKKTSTNDNEGGDENNNNNHEGSATKAIHFQRAFKIYDLNWFELQRHNRNDSERRGKKMKQEHSC